MDRPVMELISDASGFLRVRQEAAGSQPAANEAPSSSRLRQDEDEDAAAHPASGRATSAQSRGRAAEGRRRRVAVAGSSSSSSRDREQDRRRPLVAGSDGGYEHEDDGGTAIPFIAASAAAIAGLEKATYAGGMAADAAGGVTADCTSCAICMEYYVAGDELSVVPCSGRHKFHRKCAGEWLKQSHLCPLCRHALPAETNKIDT